MVGFASLMPGLQTIAVLPRSAIPREIGAGISVAAVAIPIGLAYAQITGVPTEIGLYASIVPTLAYALFGPSSRYLIVGPDTATCLLLASQEYKDKFSAELDASSSWWPRLKRGLLSPRVGG